MLGFWKKKPEEKNSPAPPPPEMTRHKLSMLEAGISRGTQPSSECPATRALIDGQIAATRTEALSIEPIEEPNKSTFVIYRETK